MNAERFFKSLAYNVLIGGTDAHAKNYSVVLIGSRAQIAPLYDVASAAPYAHRDRLRSSMKIGEHWKMLDVNRSDWSKVGRRLGLSGDRAVAWVDDLRAELPGAFERAAASLPSSVQAEAGRMAADSGPCRRYLENRYAPTLTSELENGSLPRRLRRPAVYFRCACALRSKPLLAKLAGWGRGCARP